MSEHDLRHITTSWSVVGEPDRFVMRYAIAIRSYIVALIGDPHDADDVCQDFLLQIKQKGFPRLDPERGRFRHYLIAVVRNTARAFLARKAARPASSALPVEVLADVPDEAAERQYNAEWQQCVLGSALQALEQHERRSPGNLGHTVLRLVMDHPDAGSDELAELARQRSAQDVNPVALRKQLSRARQRFAELIVQEVVATLGTQSQEEIESELCDLGLMRYVSRYWPPKLGS